MKFRDLLQVIEESQVICLAYNGSYVRGAQEVLNIVLSKEVYQGKVECVMVENGELQVWVKEDENA